MLVSPICLVGVHLLIAITDLNPVILMIIQGLVYCAFAAAFWPSIAMTVLPKHSGLCFGMASSMQNVGLAVVPMLVACVYSKSGNRYIPNVEYLFVTLAGISVFACAIMYAVDRPMYLMLNTGN